MTRSDLEYGRVTDPLKILLVEDEEDIAEPIHRVLSEEGHDVSLAIDGKRAMHQLRHESYDLVISDVRLPEVDGLTLFHWLKDESPTTPVILMSAYGNVSEAVSALRHRAVHYLSKPFPLDELLKTVAQIAQQRQLAEAFHGKHKAKHGAPELDDIIGNSSAMHGLKKRLLAIAHSDVPVLILGESGTGKELVARAIHHLSARCDRPFVALNCAALPETLFEAELFGHERGAFTGAVRKREGRFVAADGGSLFLDEVSELTPTSQAKLLRVLQTGVLQPLGSNASIKVDVRVLSATNADLRDYVQQGRFREDLYYRLKVVEQRIAALRERSGDLPLLIGHFLRMRLPPGAGVPTLSPRAWAALHQYPFPGNVRELEHAIQHALVLSHDGDIDLEHLPDEVRGDDDAPAAVEPSANRPLAKAMADFEAHYIQQVLRQTNWNRAQAAAQLGISRKNLWEKLRRHHIVPPKDDQSPN